MLSKTKQKIQLFFKNKLILHTFIVFSGTSIGAVFNFIYHLVSVRLLPIKDYGTFNTLISFMQFGIIAASPLRITFTRYFTELITKKPLTFFVKDFKRIIQKLIYITLTLVFIFFLISNNIASFIKTQFIYVFICGIIIVSMLSSAVFSALFQSFQHFKTYSFVWIASTFGKLALGGLLMFFGYGILGGLFGFLAGSILLIIIPLFFLPRIFKNNSTLINKEDTLNVKLNSIYKYCFFSIVAILSFILLISIDLILIKHFFSSLDAGRYSIAQLIGKITLFFPSALAIVIFPKSTKAYILNKSSLKPLYKFLALGSIGCFIITTFIFLYPQAILNILVGTTNPTSNSLAGILSLAMSFGALLWITINFALAIQNFKFILPFLSLAILETIVIYNYHPSLIKVAYTFLSFTFINVK